jgi:hypothetical protein
MKKGFPYYSVGINDTTEGAPIIQVDDVVCRTSARLQKVIPFQKK